MKGVDIRTVADILGQRDLRMVMKYAHLSPLHRRCSVQVLDTMGHHLVTERVFGEVATSKKPSKQALGA
jgi:hypothetical protein